MPTHKWHLEVERQASRQIDNLPPEQRLMIFGAIRELLLAENPTTVSGVRKLVGDHFGDQWRVRQGDYRIFFSILHGEVTHTGHIYKGTVFIHAVLHRSNAY